MLDGRLILITYTGRRTGKRHTLPVQYARSKDELIVFAGYHWHKKWWRSLLEQSTINVRYHGNWFEASARAYNGDVGAIVPAFPDYLRRFPESARVRGLTLDSQGNIADQRKLEEAARDAVMVRIGILGPEGQRRGPGPDGKTPD